jgi:hypothetical protein
MYYSSTCNSSQQVAWHGFVGVAGDSRPQAANNERLEPMQIN